jgi:hypothetical protein
MKFTPTELETDTTLNQWSSGQYYLQVSAFAMGQYRVHMWWKGSVGREFTYPDIIPPPF